ncbi:uncharacterized protein IAS62_004498 [Cryptococcus decagattii]|uniref:Nucleolar protein 16 n=1 Tax=Cryptococcus decagattii TaxID=1859122 RepID=A0ABZ2AX94_9TREE
MSDGNHQNPKKKRDKSSSKFKKSKRKKNKKKEKLEWLQPSSVPPLSPAPDHRSQVQPEASSANEAPMTLFPLRLIPLRAIVIARPKRIVLKTPLWRRRKNGKPTKKTLVNPPEWSVRELRGKGKLEEGLLKAMEQAEEISMAKPADPLCSKALQDKWDEHIGPVPTIAMLMAQRFGKHISPDNMALLADTMTMRAD